MSERIRGIYVPNITPFDASGRLNEDELRRIIRWLGEKGVTGFYPNGSSGEFIRLNFEERKRVVKIVCEEAGGRPVLAGASEHDLEQTLEMCAYCAELGCRAVAITGPYYYKLSQESIETYFRELAERSPIDIVVYNIPAFSSEIGFPILKNLALDCPRIVGTKDSSQDMVRFQRVLHEIQVQRPDFAVLIGWDTLLCASLFMGGDGGTLATAGVVPEVLMKIFNAAQTGDWATARATQYKLLDLFQPMIDAPNFPEGFRAGYTLRGFDTGRSRFPLSHREEEWMETMRGRLACVLAECGFAEAAQRCVPDLAGPESAGAGDPTDLRAQVEAIVRRTLEEMRRS